MSENITIIILTLGAAAIALGAGASPLTIAGIAVVTAAIPALIFQAILRKEKKREEELHEITQAQRDFFIQNEKLTAMILQPRTGDSPNPKNQPN